MDNRLNKNIGIVQWPSVKVNINLKSTYMHTTITSNLNLTHISKIFTSIENIIEKDIGQRSFNFL